MKCNSSIWKLVLWNIASEQHLESVMNKNPKIYILFLHQDRHLISLCNYIIDYSVKYEFDKFHESSTIHIGSKSMAKEVDFYIIILKK